MNTSSSLFVADAQCAKRIGISTEELKKILPELERQGFPLKDPLFANRRYWPAVKAFLDRRHGLTEASGPGAFGPPDGVEVWNFDT